MQLQDCTNDYVTLEKKNVFLGGRQEIDKLIGISNTERRVNIDVHENNLNKM